VEIIVRYHIKEWQDKTASLIAEDGHVLDIFNNIHDANEACIEQCRTEPEYIERHFTYLGASPIDFESSFV